MIFRTRLAQIIAHNEGFGLPGTIPTVRHNPGDLKHSPHGSHAGIDPNGIAIEPDDQTGIADEERQLQLFAQRGFTLRQLAETWAPAGDGNPTEAYLKSITEGLGLLDTALVRDALEIPAV